MKDRIFSFGLIAIWGAQSAVSANWYISCTPLGFIAQDLLSVLLGLDLFAGENLLDDTLFIDDESGADGAHRFLSVH